MLTRRSFVQTVGIGGAAAYIGARGRENSLWQAFEPTLEAAVDPGVICLSSNENPTGPGKAVLDAVKDAFGPAGARPGRYDGSASALIEAIAKKQRVKPENVVLGCGSTQIGRAAGRERVEGAGGAVAARAEEAGGCGGVVGVRLGGDSGAVAGAGGDARR